MGAVRKVLAAIVAFIALAAVLPLLAVAAAGTTSDAVLPTGSDARAFSAYRHNDRACPELRWQLLAGIGWIESGHGTSGGATVDSETGAVQPPILGPPLDGTHGAAVLSGEWRGRWGVQGPWLQAVGPMQLLPPTFAAWSLDGDGDGVSDPHDIDDSVATAAAYLCGAARRVADERAALLRYNHSGSYADAVLHYADALETRDGPTSMTCPVAGPVSFTDTWGAPRSGGRRHEGVDMFAAEGTPVVAPATGVLSFYNDHLGGLSFRLWGEDTYYFGTHLSRIGPRAGQIAAGSVIGYVGHTGNAATTGSHLHFEIHPGRHPGDPPNPVDPTPAVSAACADRRIGIGVRAGD